jgi:hypothetical protein
MNGCEQSKAKVFQDSAIGEVVGECDSLSYMKKSLGYSGVNAGQKF